MVTGKKFHKIPDKDLHLTSNSDTSDKEQASLSTPELKPQSKRKKAEFIRQLEQYADSIDEQIKFIKNL